MQNIFSNRHKDFFQMLLIKNAVFRIRDILVLCLPVFLYIYVLLK
jgi:hypothetical protein